MQFVTNYGNFHAQHKSLIGSNFHFCVSRFNFFSSLFFNGYVNVSNTIRQHYLFDRDQKRVSLAQFLRDSLSLRDAAHRSPCLLQVAKFCAL